MVATDFEFRYRVWLIGLIFFITFSAYSLDHVNSGVALLHVISGPSLDSAGARLGLRIIFASAAMLVLAAALLRTWAAAYLRSDVVHDPSLRLQELVADGPYRYTRNPLYLGNMLLAVGLGMMASRLGFFFLVLAMALFVYRLIGREERELLRTQQDHFRAYCAAVPRFFALSLRPRLPAGPTKPRWMQACFGESFLWLFAAAAVLYACTLNGTFAQWASAIGFLCVLVARPLARRLRIT